MKAQVLRKYDDSLTSKEWVAEENVPDPKIEKSTDGFTGKELWANADKSVQFNTPVLKEGLLYGLSASNELFCLDAQTGKTAWTTQIGAVAGGMAGGSGDWTPATGPADRTARSRRDAAGADGGSTRRCCGLAPGGDRADHLVVVGCPLR